MSNHDLLLVIDLQNVYTEGQPWACCHIRQAARNIRRLLDAGVCGEVLFTRFVPPAQPEGMWREYNRVNAAVNADAFANAMLPEMAPYLERYPLLDKSVYSSFSIPKVREAAARADRVGVVADGGLVELGTHADLVAAGGRYAQLYRSWVGCLASA